MTRLANAVFRAPLAVLRGQGGGTRSPLLYPKQAAGAGPPCGAGTKRDARYVAPGGHREGRQNAPLEMSPSKIYGFVHIRKLFPVLPIISDQPLRALSRGGGS